MLYNIWLHWHARSAQTCGLISNVPLRERYTTELGGKVVPQYRILGETYQTNFQFDAVSDDAAYLKLTERVNEGKPGERRPIQGKSYLRACRTKRCSLCGCSVPNSVRVLTCQPCRDKQHKESQ